MVTVENAYAQLEAEGYLNAREKRGYFVNPVETGPVRENPAEAREKNREQREWRLDLRGTGSGTEGFPFSVWARLMRRILTERGAELLQATPHNGVYPLRQAIADISTSSGAFPPHRSRSWWGRGRSTCII